MCARFTKACFVSLQDWPRIYKNNNTELDLVVLTHQGLIWKHPFTNQLLREMSNTFAAKFTIMFTGLASCWLCQIAEQWAVHLSETFHQKLFSAAAERELRDGNKTEKLQSGNQNKELNTTPLQAVCCLATTLQGCDKDTGTHPLLYIIKDLYVNRFV